MFKSLKNKLPLISDKLEEVTGFNGPKFPRGHTSPLGFTWQELQQFGVVKESILDEKEGFVTITRSFIAYDGSMTKTDSYTLDTLIYDKYKEGMDVDKVIEEIEDLESELEEYVAVSDDYAIVVVDQIKFLKNEFNLKDN